MNKKNIPIRNVIRYTEASAIFPLNLTDYHLFNIIINVCANTQSPFSTSDIVSN
jgi:hypothetical protein